MLEISDSNSRRVRKFGPQSVYQIKNIRTLVGVSRSRLRDGDVPVRVDMVEWLREQSGEYECFIQVRHLTTGAEKQLTLDEVENCEQMQFQSGDVVYIVDLGSESGMPDPGF